MHAQLTSRTTACTRLTPCHTLCTTAQANTIKFTPPLPRRKRSAIRRLGYGLLNKLALEFPRKFWSHALKRSPTAAAGAAAADATGTYTGSGTALGKSFGHVGDKQGEFYLFTGMREPVCRASVWNFNVCSLHQYLV
jgi:Flavin containing amine oxidoreductase